MQISQKPFHFPKKILFISLLLFSLSLTLTACSDKASGVYTAVAEFSDFLDESVLSEAENLGIASFRKFPIQITLLLSPDKKYDIFPDQETLQEELNTELREAVITAFSGQLSELGYSQDLYDPWAKQNGYGDFNGLVQSFLDKTSSDLESALSDISKSGDWTRRKKTLTLDDETKLEILDDDSFDFPIVFHGHSLTLHFSK